MSAGHELRPGDSVRMKVAGDVGVVVSVSPPTATARWLEWVGLARPQLVRKECAIEGLIWLHSETVAPMAVQEEYIGEHHFPDLTYKARCGELVTDLRKDEAEIARLRLLGGGEMGRLDVMWQQLVAERDAARNALGICHAAMHQHDKGTHVEGPAVCGEYFDAEREIVLAALGRRNRLECDGTGSRGEVGSSEADVSCSGCSSCEPDPECSLYEPGPASRMCDGNGHYMCKTCRHRTPEVAP